MAADHSCEAMQAAVRDALKRYRITDGRHFDLDDHPTDHLPETLRKNKAKRLLEADVDRLSELQERLYADASWSLLLIVQAMDAGGKDSTIKHVMSGVNPQGVSVTSFKKPDPHELAHGFLWRISRALPARGTIGIFNRSHYEDVLAPRVHPEQLDGSGLPPALRKAEHLWRDRLGDIAAFEAYLGRQGTRVVKVFLHVSRAEQKRRLLARLDTPEKLWKFEASDLVERARWPEYGDAYAAAIRATATAEAPWYVIPADRKWYTRLAVAAAVIDALEGLDLRRPEAPAAKRDIIDKARTTLKGE